MKRHSCMAVLLALAVPIVTCSSSTTHQNNIYHTHEPYVQSHKKPSPQRPNNTPHTPYPQSTHQQAQQQNHQQMCNILGHASNIFTNFVHLVSRPNDRDHIGQQVGNMAQNIFHIVAEAAKPNAQRKHDNYGIALQNTQDVQNILDYLQSEAFIEQLTQKIMEQIH